jgi:hypothetical protein
MKNIDRKHELPRTLRLSDAHMAIVEGGLGDPNSGHTMEELPDFPKNTSETSPDGTIRKSSSIGPESDPDHEPMTMATQVNSGNTQVLKYDATAPK